MTIDTHRLQKQSGIIGTSKKINELLGMIGQVAPVDISVLVSGESGVGKEVMARAIHRHSKRLNNPMITAILKLKFSLISYLVLNLSLI